ncbi:MAG TPA: glycosyltransferase [Ramlibacter sp.]|uniref:glycosyltransferase family 4 protein n=1 Tax=Ramlibacter sp. TaxID=1917967 RepID=UPI002D7F334A|nr:glycosyltransferase [Ramlibacter sp.]HET8744047.1 glycosyltransferase [Ramlibacter sp.]
MLILLVLCGVVSAVACGLLLRWGREGARRYGAAVPQRFHVGDIPRLGGAAMFLACAFGWAWLPVASALGIAHNIPFDASLAMTWCLVALTGAASGVVEDLTHRLAASLRMVSTALAGLLALILFGLLVPRTGIASLDAFWQHMPWLQVGVALLVMTGLPHAFNLIDGYNGLAGTVALICCAALAHVALQLGDRQVAATTIVLAGASIGFLVWNYPHGLIFAGDGGAYLWGLVLGINGIQLVQRHPEVSPWFPILLLIYPIWEAIFSIYRKVVRGQSPSLADALHFHQLIYRRVVREVFHDDATRRVLMRNNRTSPYLWGFTLLTVVPAVVFWRNTPVLVGFTVLFIVSYLWAYHSIVRFRMQRWLRRVRSLYPS